MECFEQKKSNIMSENEGNEFYQKEFKKLEKAIYAYMTNIQYASDLPNKEMIRMAKTDSNYIIKDWYAYKF
tara:strand:+ start:136 stop:348 length:213 start_codon:yes stop_codon:yes gene_type:complete